MPIAPIEAAPLLHNSFEHVHPDDSVEMPGTGILVQPEAWELAGRHPKTVCLLLSLAVCTLYDGVEKIRELKME